MTVALVKAYRDAFVATYVCYRDAYAAAVLYRTEAHDGVPAWSERYPRDVVAAAATWAGSVHRLC